MRSGVPHINSAKAAVIVSNLLIIIILNINRCYLNNKSILVYFIDKRGILRKFISKIFTVIINLITINNLKYYNASSIHLLENVRLFSGKQNGFGYSAELITSQIRAKKTYIEIEIKPYLKTAEKSEALRLHNIVSVLGSIAIIFLKQIIYMVRKII